MIINTVWFAQIDSDLQNEPISLSFKLMDNPSNIEGNQAVPYQIISISSNLDSRAIPEAYAQIIRIFLYELLKKTMK